MKRLIMLVLTCKLSLASYALDFVHECEVSSSWQTLTDTAEIRLPAAITADRNKLREVLKPGDACVLELGYDERYNPCFEGYITGLTPSTPLSVVCEDEMRQLKQTVVTDNLKGATLKTLLNKHFEGYTINAVDAELENQYLIVRKTKAKILEDLRDRYGLFSFFRQGTLVVGKPYDPAYAQTQRFRFQFNIIEDELVYKRQEDVRLQVTAISNQSNGERIEVRLGDQDGETRTLNFANLSKKSLEEAAQRELDRLKYDGYRGSFTAFGEPFVRHGDMVVLEHPEDSDKTGKYWVDRVDYTFGVNGYRQKITLGPKA